MAIVDFKSMKNDKALFDSMADRLIKDTLNKKKYYETLYNKANMLKNEINKLLLDLNDICISNNIAVIKPIHDCTYHELEELVVDCKADNKIVEKIKIILYKIKMRLDEIKELRTKMIKLDLYEGAIAGIEDDTLDEEYIDMDRIRLERGIDLDDDIITDIKNVIDLLSVEDNNKEYYEYTFDGKANLKQIAQEIYGNPSYWVYIYNFDDNKDILKKFLRKLSSILMSLIRQF